MKITFFIEILRIFLFLNLKLMIISGANHTRLALKIYTKPVSYKVHIHTVFA